MIRQAAVALLILSAPLQPSQAGEYRYPGVYLQERPGPKRIDGVSTSTNSGQVQMVPAGSKLRKGDFLKDSQPQKGQLQQLKAQQNVRVRSCKTC